MKAGQNVGTATGRDRTQKSENAQAGSTRTGDQRQRLKHRRERGEWSGKRGVADVGRNGLIRQR